MRIINYLRTISVKKLSYIAAVWGLLYSIYRSFYAFGGTALLIGTLSQPDVFRQINAVGAAIILLLSLLPLVMINLWKFEKWRRWLLLICWLVAVATIAHAAIDVFQRILSLAGYLQIEYPDKIWEEVNHRSADLQDLFLNEPWFLVEGLLFAVIGYKNIAKAETKKKWIFSIIIAVAIAFIIGSLSALGIIDRVIIG